MRIEFDKITSLKEKESYDDDDWLMMHFNADVQMTCKGFICASCIESLSHLLIGYREIFFVVS